MAPIRKLRSTTALLQLGFGGLACISSNLWAEELSLELQQTDVIADIVDDSRNTDSYRSGFSTMGNKIDVPALEQAQTVDVVTPRVLKDQKPQSLDDVAKFVPGVNVGNSFGGTRDALMIRGFAKDEENGVLRDGVRQVTGRNFQSITTERVEVLKGPAGLLYSMNEPGGVINIVSRKPQFQASQSLGGSLADSGGGDAWVDVTGPLGESGLAYRLIGQRKHEDHWRDFGVNEHTLIAPSLAYEHEKISALLAYQYIDADDVLDRAAAMDANGTMIGSRDQRMDEKFSATHNKQQSVNFTGEYRWTDATRTRMTLGYAEKEYTDEQVRFGSRISTTSVPRTYAINEDGRYSTEYQAFELLTNQDLIGTRHEMLWGVDRELRKKRGPLSGSGALSTFNPYNPVYDGEPPANISWSDGRDFQRTTGYGAYFKDNIHIGDRWIVSPGLRWQHYEVEAGQEHNADAGFSQSSGEPLAYLGVLYKVRDDLSLYASYSESFLAPAIETDDAYAPLTSYKPETGRQYEIGAKFDNGRMSSTIALFDIRKNNVYQKDQNTMTQWLAGQVTSRGVEVSATGYLTQRLSVLGHYAYTQARYSQDVDYQDNYIPNVPRHVAGLYLTYDGLGFAGGKLRSGIGARYVGERYIEQNNDLTVPGYTVTDAFVSWSTTQLLGKETTLQLNLGNLTDKTYIVSTGNQSRRMSWGEERNARLSAEVTF
ncbi:MAG: TonB-dependent siderophore receptor [Paucimonas sp.]|jgi:iron complex outermembrane receptor protein|nr:TonB-dependent siderophore receptor [Paucimonas sp.]